MRRDVAVRATELVGGTLALDFANTISSPWSVQDNAIESFEALLAWAQRAGVIDAAGGSALLRGAASKPAETARVVRAALDGRDAIYDVFSAIAGRREPPGRQLTSVLTAYADAVSKSSPTVTPAGAELVWTNGGLSRPLHPIFYDAGRLLLSSEAGTVKECAGCPWLFLDRSRNHSRRWCDMRVCGSRSKMRRYRNAR